MNPMLPLSPSGMISANRPAGKTPVSRRLRLAATDLSCDRPKPGVDVHGCNIL